MTEDRNRRQFTRIPMNVQAEVHCGTGAVLSGVVSDLSLNGMLVSASGGVPAGTSCTIRLILGAGESLTLEAKGQIIRSGADGVAVAIDEIDSDSFEHLRNVVLYNSDDPDRVSDEFLGHLGIKRR